MLLCLDALRCLVSQLCSLVLVLVSPFSFFIILKIRQGPGLFIITVPPSQNDIGTFLLFNQILIDLGVALSLVIQLSMTTVFFMQKPHCDRDWISF